MRSSIFLILIILLSINCCGQTVVRYDIIDMHALNGIADKWERYWNIHKADSLATLFAPDIDFVTKSGEKSRNHIQSQYMDYRQC